jgi:hypothetical protein
MHDREKAANSLSFSGFDNLILPAEIVAQTFRRTPLTATPSSPPFHLDKLCIATSLVYLAIIALLQL